MNKRLTEIGGEPVFARRCRGCLREDKQDRDGWSQHAFERNTAMPAGVPDALPRDIQTMKSLAKARSLGHAGEIETRRARDSGHLVTLYNSEAQGMDSGPEAKYSILCQHHGHMVSVGSKKLGRSHMAAPTEWCEPCRCEKEGGHKINEFDQCSECGTQAEDIKDSVENCPHVKKSRGLFFLQPDRLQKSRFCACGHLSVQHYRIHSGLQNMACNGCHRDNPDIAYHQPDPDFVTPFGRPATVRVGDLHPDSKTQCDVCGGALAEGDHEHPRFRPAKVPEVPDSLPSDIRDLKLSFAKGIKEEMFYGQEPHLDRCRDCDRIVSRGSGLRFAEHGAPASSTLAPWRHVRERGTPEADHMPVPAHRHHTHSSDCSGCATAIGMGSQAERVSPIPDTLPPDVRDLRLSFAKAVPATVPLCRCGHVEGKHRKWNGDSSGKISCCTGCFGLDWEHRKHLNMTSYHGYIADHNAQPAMPPLQAAAMPKSGRSARIARLRPQLERLARDKGATPGEAAAAIRMMHKSKRFDRQIEHEDQHVGGATGTLVDFHCARCGKVSKEGLQCPHTGKIVCERPQCVKTIHRMSAWKYDWSGQRQKWASQDNDLHKSMQEDVAEATRVEHEHKGQIKTAQQYTDMRGTRSGLITPRGHIIALPGYQNHRLIHPDFEDRVQNHGWAHATVNYDGDPGLTLTHSVSRKALDTACDVAERHERKGKLVSWVCSDVHPNNPRANGGGLLVDEGADALREHMNKFKQSHVDTTDLIKSLSPRAPSKLKQKVQDADSLHRDNPRQPS